MEKAEGQQMHSGSESEGAELGSSSFSPPPFQLFASPAQEGSQGDAPMQLMAKEVYPWKGTVVGPVTLQESANGADGTMAELSPGARLNVIGQGESETLKVEVDVDQAGVVIKEKGSSAEGGGVLTGFVIHQAIDDTTAHAMENMVGQDAIWSPSQPGSDTDFAKYAEGPSNGAAPQLTPSTTTNCWEVILIAALSEGLIDHAFVKKLYAEKSSEAWPGMLTQGEQTVYNPATGKVPNRGDLVFFNGTSHVSLAANATEIYSFWPEQTPDSPLEKYDPDGDGIQNDADNDGFSDYRYGEMIMDGEDPEFPLPTPDQVEKVTIEEMIKRIPPPCTVTFAPPAW